MERYPNFDLARLLLAGEVMFLHYSTFEGLGWNHAMRGWYLNPVPAFIAISGFLILRSLEQSGSWREFALRRIYRVVPAFVASLLLVCIVSGPRSLPATILDYLAAGLSGRSSGNGVLWSLMVEEVLYATLAIGVSIGLYRARWPIWLWVLGGAIVIPGLLLEYPRSVERIGWVLASFPIGSLMYMYRERLAAIPSYFWLALLIACVVVPVSASDRYLMHRWTMLGTFAVVGVGAWGPRLPQPKWDISFGLYIYHIPIYTFVVKSCGLSVYAAIPIAILAAALSWLIVERPVLRLKEKTLKYRSCAEA